MGSSDAHFLEEIGQGFTELTVEAPTFAELALAFKGAGGRGAVRVGRDTPRPARQGEAAMHDLSLYLLEILENSTRAGASRVDIAVTIDHASDELRLAVDDDGSGLTATPEQTLDPFYTTKPGKKTGLGLSLLKADAQAAGGDLGHRAVARAWAGSGWRPSCNSTTSTGRPSATWPRPSYVTAATNPDVAFTVSLRGDEFTPPLDHGPPQEAVARLRLLSEELVT